MPNYQTEVTSHEPPEYQYRNTEECLTCGALVVETDRHADWHEGIGGGRPNYLRGAWFSQQWRTTKK